MQRLLQVVLTAWREAERVASERAEGSQEHEAALVAAGRLRSLYGELVDSARADHDEATLATLPSPEALDARSTGGNYPGDATGRPR